MKFGIIGSGMIAKVHANAIAAMEGSHLHSVFNHRPEGAQKLAAEHGAKAVAELDTFLADPDLEIVTICTPSGAHFEPTLAALRAGKHVICEKPLEVSTALIDELIDAATDAGVTLAGVLNRRFTPAMSAFKQAAELGRFGTLTSASCYVKWFRDQAYYDSADWRGTWALDGGGVLMNQAIHAIDALIHLAGPVTAVQAKTACLAHVDIEVEDIGVAIVEFANGALGIIEGTTCTWSHSGHPVRIQLAGTAGSAFLADERFEVWDFKEDRPEDADIRANLMQSSGAGLGANNPAAIHFLQHQRNFEDVVNAIEAGREPAISALETRKAVAVIQAIYESSRNGGKRLTVE
jgi:predicted dehydrogenase